MDDEKNVESTECEATVISDPYTSQSPFRITGEIPPDDEYSHGQVLRWCNETVRNRARGWRGWIPLEWGDKYTGQHGEKLKEYGIADTPVRMQGPDHTDNLVRRGDVILCRLRKEWFEQRREAVRAEDKRRRKKISGQDTIAIKTRVPVHTYSKMEDGK